MPHLIPHNVPDHKLLARSRWQRTKAHRDGPLTRGGFAQDNPRYNGKNRYGRDASPRFRPAPNAQALLA